MKINVTILAFYTVLLTMLSLAKANEYDKDMVIEALTNEIAQQYVEVNKIDTISGRLNTFKNSPQFSNVLTESELAALLTTELQTIDKHFSVQWQSPHDSITKKPQRESWFTKLGRKNSGFNKVEILDGNVGYIDFWGFDTVSEKSKSIVEGVMTLVSDTDALIFDIRNNGGGSPEMVKLISSYFLPANTHLNSLYWRATDTTNKFYTSDNVDGKVRLTVPIYILTSKDTFSAAEEFAYNLKHLNRATLVGEVTKGGANPWRYFQLGEGFRAAIPIGKAINPNTLSNWESVGVKPHIESFRNDALNVSYQLALSAIKNTVSNKHQLHEINVKLAELASKE